MTIRYGSGIRNTGFIERPSDFTDEDWHADASADTGTSHTLPGRVFLVQCEWCPKAFAARTKAEAMAMFREHESTMLKLSHAKSWQPAASEGRES